MRLECEFEDYEIVDDCAYVFSKFGNRFYSINIDTNRATFLGAVPFEQNDANRLYSSLVHSCGKIYLIPCNAHSIAVYDISKKNFSKIPLEHPNMSFMSYALWNEYIIMFGFKCDSILRLNIHTNIVDYLEIGLESNTEEEVVFRKQNCFVNDKIVIPFFSRDAILVFSPKNMAYEIINIGVGNSGYAGVLYYHGKLYLAPRYKGETIVSFDFPCQEFNNSITKTRTGDSKSIYSFVGIVIEKGTISLYTYGEKEETEYFVDTFKINSGNYYCGYMNGDETKVYNYKSGYIQIRDHTGKLVKKSIDIELDVKSIYINGILIAEESGSNDLSDYLDIVINEEQLCI